MQNINIILFDDHKIFSDLLAEALNREYNFNVSVVNSYQKLLKQLSLIKIDILILDLDLGGMSGFDVIQKIRQSENKTKILILSAETDKSTVKSILNLDIAGYISKTQGVNIIANAIYSVMNGVKFLCPKTIEILTDDINTDFYIDITRLTKREKDVLKLIGSGFSNEEISEKLTLSIHTIKTHRKNIRLKFNLTSFSELSQVAIKYKKYL